MWYQCDTHAVSVIQVISVQHRCCQPGPAIAGMVWVLRVWHQCCGWAWDLRAWHGCCEPGTGAAGLAQALQAWHKCCEPGVGTRRLAGAPGGWQGHREPGMAPQPPGAAPPSPVVPSGCEPPVSVSVASGRTHPRRVTQPEKLFLI